MIIVARFLVPRPNSMETNGRIWIRDNVEIQLRKMIKTSSISETKSMHNCRETIDLSNRSSDRSKLNLVPKTRDFFHHFSSMTFLLFLFFSRETLGEKRSCV